MKKGFFDLSKTDTDEMKGRKPLSCVTCGLYKTCLSPKMKPYGKFQKKVMIVGEGPGKIEDERNKQWQGRMGRILQKALKNFDFKLFRDAVSLNAVNCRPPRNKTPDKKEIECCRRKVLDAINKYKPHVIILLGSSAVESVIGKHYKNRLDGVTKWNGYTIPDQKYKAWVCPIFHPSFVDKKQSKYKNQTNVAETIWYNDIRKALRCVHIPFPDYSTYEDCIHYVFTEEDFRKAIIDINTYEKVYFDIETTGIRPYRKGHKILCTSVAVAPDKVYVWMNDKKRNNIFSKTLTNGYSKKSAHNIQFEDMWVSEIFKCNVNNWDWCSLNAAHILDNRKGVSGLKFQTYVNFGICGYDDKVESYMESKEKNTYGANGFNRLEEFIKDYGEKELMRYCALDSLFGFWLWEKQKDIINACSKS